MLTIIPFACDHAEAAARLHSTSFTRHWSAEDFKQYANDLNIHGVSAFKSDQFVGFILARKTQDEAEILTFAVKSQHQRQGVGQELLKYILNLLLHNETKNVYLETSEDNDGAKALYKQVGFLKIGERPDYYCTPTGKYKAAYLYKKPL